jgi:glycosyltransferase involved in cell wall biosynthesis
MPAIEELLPVPGSRLQALPTSDVLRTPLAGGPARLRVGLVVEHFDPMRGGLEQWSFRFARELVSRGHEVHVVSQEFVEATRELAVVRHPVRCGRSRLAFGRQARVLLEPLALDVIHDMGAGWYCDVFHPHGGSWLSVTRRKLDMLPGWLRGLKRWLNPLLPRQRQYDKLMARQYADNGQVLLALSRSVADDFMRFHDVGPERIRVVYNGVDTEEFSPACCAERRGPVRRRLGIGPDTLLALVVGHNFHLKGVPTLLDAMGRLGGEERPSTWRWWAGNTCGRGSDGPSGSAWAIACHSSAPPASPWTTTPPPTFTSTPRFTTPAAWSSWRRLPAACR